jgi:hypothetical protein
MFDACANKCNVLSLQVMRCALKDFDLENIRWLSIILQNVVYFESAPHAQKPWTSETLFVLVNCQIFMQTFDISTKLHVFKTIK